MNKNDSLHILFKTLVDILPYEYNEKLIDHEATIVLTKEDSDRTIYISPVKTNDDDLVVAISYDDPSKGFCGGYETLHWTLEEEQIPLNTILADIKHYL